MKRDSAESIYSKVDQLFRVVHVTVYFLVVLCEYIKISFLQSLIMQNSLTSNLQTDF